MSQNINQYPRPNWGIKLAIDASDMSLVSDERNFNEEVIFSPYLIAQTYGNRLPFSFDTNDTNSVQPFDLNYKQYNFNNVFVSTNYYNPDNIDLSCLTANTSCDIGLTGIDNGLVTGMTAQTITFTNGINDFTKFDRLSFDRRLKMFQVTGYTSSNIRFSGFDKTILYEVVSKDDSVGYYHELYGGFYQGFYKLFGYDYEIFPERMNKGWAVEMLLKPRFPENDEYTPSSGETTLNVIYPQNKNIFFYMGTRAENKYYHHADGFMGGITAYTRVTSGLVGLETCACCNTGVTNSRCIYVYPPRSINGEHDPHHNYGCNTCGCSSSSHICTSCGCPIIDNEICGWECKNHTCESSVQSTCETDPLFDSMSNAISFKLCGSPNNPSIGVKVLRFTGDCVTTGSCETSGITYQTGYTITEYCSPTGIYDYCENINPAYLEEEHWFQLDAVWERYTWLDTCDLWYRGGLGDITERKLLESLANNSMVLIAPPYTQIGYPPPGEVELVNLNEKWLLDKEYRNGRLKIYINGRRFFTIENFEEIIPRGLNTDKEKQVGVPFNISWGGGTQGLRENLVPKPIPNCDITYGVVIGLNLQSIVLPGSVNITYNLSSSSSINEDIVVEFTNTLGMSGGTDIVITTGVTINANSTTGQTLVSIDNNYELLNQTSTFENITINGVLANSSFDLSINTTFSTQTVIYTADNTTIFANPERGFQRFTTNTNSDGTYRFINQSQIIGWRTGVDKVTVIYRYIMLTEFINNDSIISNTYLSNLQTDFDRIRNAGLKVILRPAYTVEYTPEVQPNKQTILNHITQLSSVINSNDDIIVSVQSGFIGVYGEWYYTEGSVEFGDEGTISPAQWLNRKDVVDSMLFNFNSSIPIQVRYAEAKREMYGSATLNDVTAFQNTPTARVGFYNDAFLNNYGDMGTYDVNSQCENPFGTVDYDFVANSAQYLPMNGETNGLNSCNSGFRTTGGNAVVELNALNFSTLNRGYSPDVWDGWISQGYYDEIARNLGYRLQLNYITLVVGDTIDFTMNISNVGYGNILTPKNVYLIFKNNLGVEYPKLLTVDPRFWTSTQTISQSLINDIPNGEYDLFLHISDINLETRPEYNIRLANIGTWDDITGYNDLLMSVVIQ